MLEVNPENSLIITEKTKLPRERFTEDSIRVWSWINQYSNENTKALYVRIIKEFFRFHWNVGVKEIRSPHVTVFLKQKNDIKASTKNLYLNVLSSLFSHLAKDGYIERNPIIGIFREKSPDFFGQKVIPFEIVRSIIENEPIPRNKVLFYVLYYTGLRVSEALSLHIGSFRRSDSGHVNMIVIGKGSKVRSIRLEPFLWKIVSGYIESENILNNLFTGMNGAPLTRARAFQIVKKASSRVGLKTLPSPHWFRHSNATHAIENGAPIHVVQVTLGHADISTTGKYLSANPLRSSSEFLKK